MWAVPCWVWTCIFAVHIYGSIFFFNCRSGPCWNETQLHPHTIFNPENCIECLYNNVVSLSFEKNQQSTSILTLSISFMCILQASLRNWWRTLVLPSRSHSAWNHHLLKAFCQCLHHLIFIRRLAWGLIYFCHLPRWKNILVAALIHAFRLEMS